MINSEEKTKRVFERIFALPCFGFRHEIKGNAIISRKEIPIDCFTCQNRNDCSKISWKRIEEEMDKKLRRKSND